jgi:plasmid stabilization system protein ParE
MFTQSQIDLLKSVGRNANHPKIGTPNPQLDEVIHKLRKDNPMAFLRDVDLQERVFIHQPVSSIQLKGYIKPLLERA